MDTQKVLWQLAQQVAELTAKVDILWKIMTIVVITIVSDVVMRFWKIIREYKNGKNHKNNGK